jgi:hypothetical protein
MTNTAFRKKSTLRRIEKRRRWKSLALPTLFAMAGIGLKIFFGYQPVEAFVNWLEAGWLLLANQQSLDEWIADHPAIQWLIGWVAAPIMLFVLAWVVVKLPPVRWLIDRIFPDPPIFVFADLDAEREATMTRLDRRALPLIGRDEVLGELITLLDQGAVVPSFRWQMLSGPSGVGKTRLAIEWLEKAQAAGWDFGIIDPEDSEMLKGWRARRPTALVIDEARSAWPELESCISRLQSGSDKRRVVRLLVIAQIAPYASGAAPEEIKDSEALPALALAPLKNENLAELAHALASDNDRADMIIRECGGRPRAAIILANATDANDLATAMTAWAFRVVPELRSEEGSVDESLALGIIASGLAGPFPATQLHSIASNFSVLLMLRFFPSARQEELEETLPALLPEDLGQELAMRLLQRLGPALREVVTKLLIEHAPDRIEAGLGNIWRDHPGYFDGTGEHGKNCAPAVTLRAVQAAFDKGWPDRVEASRNLASDLIDLIANIDSEWGALEPHLSALLTLAGSRPFDSYIRIHEAIGLANAIPVCGDAKDFAALEHWGARLIALAEHPDFASNADIRVEEARGVASATGHYAEAQDFDAFERWGARLIALAEHPDFTSLTNIRICEAIGTANALACYAKARDSVSLERWGAHLIALAERPDFSSNTDIRVNEAIGTANAMAGYDEAKDSVALERWGARLITLAEHPDFASNADIRASEAKGAAGAMSHYRNVKDFVSLERWGERLIALAEHVDFSSNTDIRRAEAGGAVHAMSYYAAAADFVSLERWGQRMVALAEHPDFKSNTDIRISEAKGANNAMYHYRKVEDFDALERWGKRLTALAEHPDFTSNADIREVEAGGAVNAIDCYRAAGRSGSGPYNSWRTRLAKTALAFPYDSKIQLHAKDFGVDYLEQRSRDWPYGKGKLPSPQA